MNEDIRRLDVLGIADEYRRGHASLVADFYIPCLNASTAYWRAAGYFTSTSLALVAAGLSRFLTHDGEMRLIASPVLSPEDAAAIRRGVEARTDVLAAALLRHFDPSDYDSIVRDRLGFLAWLVAAERLEIRIALTTSGQGIYHEKFGLFFDGSGNSVAFSGSPNETFGGLEANFESIDVFKSWNADAHRVELKRIAFEDLWSNRMPGAQTVPIPDAIRDRLLTLRPMKIPTRDPLEPQGVPLASHVMAKESARPPARGYQQEAIAAWLNNDEKGVLSMATGTGKTLTGLHCAAESLGRHKSMLLVVSAPYVHLVDQWADEIRAFGWLPTVCYGSSKKWKRALETELSDLQLGLRNLAVCVVTQDALTSDHFAQVLASLKPGHRRMLIGDEVHGLGSAGYLTRLQRLEFQSTLGLSATPERWRDDETDMLYEYFGQVVYEYALQRAIEAGFLVPYRYVPRLVPLMDEEMERYVAISRKLARLRYGEADSRSGELSDAVGALLRRRAGVLNGAAGKLPVLTQLLDEQATLRHSLVYVTPETLEDAVRVASDSGRRSVHRFTFREGPLERRSLLEAFADGVMDILVAIKCLDQGVNVPSTQTAYLLASGTNSREFVQRRGRILRRSPGKESATIFDFIAVPQAAGHPDSWRYERSIVRREILRFKEFAGNAMNRVEAQAVVLKLQTAYGLLDI